MSDIKNTRKLRVTPAESYENDLDRNIIVEDARQSLVVDYLENVFVKIENNRLHRKPRLFSWLFGSKSPYWSPVRGAYIWGDVGRGKTFLVDKFFECIGGNDSSRIHFHTFMRKIHTSLRENKDSVDPIRRVAESWVREQRVLCLDEFHVNDITDAMLLAKILEVFFAEGVTLLITSNEPPGDLYQGGLQRARFLPAIEMLEDNLEVICLDGEQDYRLRMLEQAPVYYIGEPGVRDKELNDRFSLLSAQSFSKIDSIFIEGREIAARKLSDGIAWFDFEVLCGGFRSTADYIELARLHHTLFVGDIPFFGVDDSDAARRFINLIDEIYDRNVNLIVSAVGEPEELYKHTRLAKPFKRTASRLREMRSREYLARQHRTN